jgi:probable rRNA maturation factor
MTVDIDIILSSNDWDGVDDLDPLTRRCIAASVAESGVRLASGCEMSVTFCADADIRKLNAQWRGKDAATNVLSFPTPGSVEAKPLLGDIVVAYETVAREALEQNKTLNAHIAHMIMHGFLHLIGYDHESAAEAEEMESLERRIASSLGLRDPYAQAGDDATDQPNKAHVNTI